MAERVRNVTYHHPVANPVEGGEEYDTVYFNSTVENIIGRGLRRNENVSVGDRRYSSSLPGYYRLRCVKAGRTSNVAPDFSGVIPTAATISLASASVSLAAGADADVAITTDSDGDYYIVSSDETVATASVYENTLTVTGVAAGTATITVLQLEGSEHAASNSAGLSVTVTSA